MTTHTRESILALITEKPQKFVDLAGPKGDPARLVVRPIVDELVASGLAMHIYIDRGYYYALTTWTQDPKDALAIALGNARRTIDGCLIWSGNVDSRRGPMGWVGYPQAWIAIRRMVWELTRGVELKYQDTIRPSCGNWACIEHEHMIKGLRSDKGKGRTNSPVHNMRISRAKRANIAKLTPEIVAAIRESDATNVAEAEKWGVSDSTISSVRHHETWKEYRQGLFTGLVGSP